jgi:hypothetical protein
MRCYSSHPDYWHEWDEQIVVLGEGQHPYSVLEKKPVMTLVNVDTIAFRYNWISDPPKPEFTGKIIQMIHLTGQYDPFTIQLYEGGEIFDNDTRKLYNWYSVIPTWNHWPTAQIKSATRYACFPDRAAHTSISKKCLPTALQQQGNIPFKEKYLIEGMTNDSAASLIGLARSLLYPPTICNVSGGISHGYDKAQRAYEFTMNAEQLSFRVNASDVYPIENLCLVIKNWGSRTADAKLRVVQAPGQKFSQGIIINTDGKYTKIIWVPVSAKSVQDFFIDRVKPARTK